MKSPMGLDANLPVMDLLKEAFSMLWEKRKPMTKVFLPIIAVLALLDLVGSLFEEDMQSLFSLLLLVISLALSVLMATTCHQYTLGQGDNVTNALHKWGKKEARYFVRILQIMLIVCVFFFLVYLGLVFLFNVQQELVPLLALVAIFPALYLWGRFSITLPEIALGQYSSLKRAWNMSSGNGVRLAFVVIVIPLILMTPLLLLHFVDNHIIVYVAAICSYIGTLVSLVLLSLSYRFLKEFYEGDIESEKPEISSMDA